MKRKAFYKKNNYKIIEIDSNKYSNDLTKWKKNNENKKCKSDCVEQDNDKLLIGKCLVNLNNLKK